MLEVDEIEGVKKRVYQVQVISLTENPNTSINDKKTHKNFLKMFKDTYTMSSGDVCSFRGFEFNTTADYNYESFTEFNKNITKMAEAKEYNFYYSVPDMGGEMGAYFYVECEEGMYQIVFSKESNY